MDASTISPTSPLKGGCFCGTVSYALTAPPVMSAYCHCTQCQRLNACPFIHTVHFPSPAFSWTHPGALDTLDSFVNPFKPHKTRYRCKACGCTLASFNANTQRTSVWGAQLERDAEGRIARWEDVKPTAHVFYRTRMLDINDDLEKWEGYAGRSERLG